MIDTPYVLLGIGAAIGWAWFIRAMLRDRQTMRRYMQQVGRQTPDAFTITRTTPSREPGTRPDVLVPALQSGFPALVVLLVLRLLDVDLRVAGILAGAVMLAIYFWRMRVFERLLAVVEVVSQTDIDGGGIGVTGNGSIAFLNRDAARAKAEKAQRADQEKLSKEQLIRFVRKCFKVGATSEEKLEIPPGSDVQKAYWERRDALITLGIARWRDPKSHTKGWEIITDLPTALTLIQDHTVETTGAQT